MKNFVYLINTQLLPHLQITSLHSTEPIVVEKIPSPWKLCGIGNYAAVLYHPAYPHWVVKVYAPGRPGLKEEVEVYQKLGDHPAYSKCYYHQENYLVLKRLTGTTLYNCMHHGIRIPRQVIIDVDQALHYARTKGLYPHDVHGKNVMMKDGRGYVVDVSDFYKQEYCSKWKDLKKAYYKIYLPFFYHFPIPVPYFVLNLVRKCYRKYKRYLFSS